MANQQNDHRYNENRQSQSWSPYRNGTDINRDRDDDQDRDRHQSIDDRRFEEDRSERQRLGARDRDDDRNPGNMGWRDDDQDRYRGGQSGYGAGYQRTMGQGYGSQRYGQQGYGRQGNWQSNPRDYRDLRQEAGNYGGREFGGYGRDMNRHRDGYGGDQRFGSQTGYSQGYGGGQGYDDMSGYGQSYGNQSHGRDFGGYGQSYGGHQDRYQSYGRQSYDNQGQSQYRAMENHSPISGGYNQGNYNQAYGQGQYRPMDGHAPIGQQSYGQGNYGQGNYGQGQSHRGKGPSGYTRSDERVREEVSDALSDDHDIDASSIEVTVKNGEVTLTGTVSDRRTKRMAEDCVECVSGVKEVVNNLRVKQEQSASGNQNRNASASGSTSMSSSTQSSADKDDTTKRARA